MEIKKILFYVLWILLYSLERHIIFLKEFSCEFQIYYHLKVNKVVCY